MYEDIKTHLKRLQTIDADGDFAAHTKGRVLAGRGPQVASPFLMITGGVAVAAFAVTLVVVIFNPTPPTVTALDTTALQHELQGMKLDVQLQKLDYTQKVQDTITSALVEIGGKTNHLNTQLIESENNLMGAFDGSASSSSEQIDALLNQVLE